MIISAQIVASLRFLEYDFDFFIIPDSFSTVDGALPLLSAMCGETGFAELIDSKVCNKHNRIASSEKCNKGIDCEYCFREQAVL